MSETTDTCPGCGRKLMGLIACEGDGHHRYPLPAIEEHDPADRAYQAMERAERDSETVPGTTVPRSQGGERGQR